jgi:uncharacterized protein with HEPN domain
MRRDEQYLLDIIEAAEEIGRYLADIESDQFLGNQLLRSAVLHQLTIIGEAAARLPTELRERHADVPWRDIIAFRNLAVHAYFRIEWDLVWETAVNDVPLLRRQVDNILRLEFGEERTPGY